ncbi:MAG: peptidase, partial [bacterium]|nr:peptidase [bacterium]
LATILEGEGGKARVILGAEASRERQILEAEGEAIAILKIAEARALGLTLIKNVKPDSALLTIQGFDALKELGRGQATKIIVPNDLAGLAGSLKSLAEIIKD